MTLIQSKDTRQLFHSLKRGGQDNPVNLETALHPGMWIDFFSFSSESECCRASMQPRINKTRVLYYRQHKTYFWVRVGDWESGIHRKEDWWVLSWERSSAFGRPVPSLCVMRSYCSLSEGKTWTALVNKEGLRFSFAFLSTHTASGTPAFTAV